MIARRKFICINGLALLGLHISRNLLIDKSISFLSKIVTETIAQKLKNAADLRRGINSNSMQLFSVQNNSSDSSNLLQAKAIYYDVIAMDSNEVRAYNGIRKILLQDKYKELEVLELFTSVQAQNSSSIVFKERCAKEYMRIALGNKKFSEQLNLPLSTLDHSIQLFEEVLALQPLNPDYSAQLQKAQSRKGSGDEIDDRDNPQSKIRRRENRQKYENRFSLLTAQQVLGKLNKLLQKPREKNRDKQIRDVYKTYILKLVQTGNISEATIQLENLYLFDKDDCDTLNKLRMHCSKYKQFDVLERTERNNDRIKNNYWSKIALGDVLLKRHKFDGSTNISEVDNCIAYAQRLSRTFDQDFEVKSRIIKIELIKGNLANANKQLLAFAEFISGIQSAHSIDRFNRLAVMYYKQNNEINKAFTVIDIALKRNDMPIEGILMNKIAVVNSHRNTKKPIHDQRLNELRDFIID